MSDLKSKLPDLKELGEITGKLFKDIKTSVEEIISSYKKKRATTHHTNPSKPEKTTASVKVEVTAETSKAKKPAAKPRTTKAAKSSEASKDK